MSTVTTQPKRFASSTFETAAGLLAVGVASVRVDGYPAEVADALSLLVAALLVGCCLPVCFASKAFVGGERGFGDSAASLVGAIMST